MNEIQKTSLIVNGSKVALPIVGTIGVLLLGRSVYKKLKGGNKDGSSYSKAPSIAKMTIDYNNLTITPNDSALMAQALYQCMQGSGTKSEETIYDIINNKVKTKDDLLLIISKFGLRKNLWGTRSRFIGKDINLMAWLNIDLETRELNKIRPTFVQFGIPL